jgi:hypothetical protein
MHQAESVMTLPGTFYTRFGRYPNITLAFIGSLSFALYILLGRLEVAGQPAAIAAALTQFFAIIAGLFLLLLFAGMIVRTAGQNKPDLNISLIIITVGAVLFRGALLGQSPWLSNDIYRYLWDARLVDQGINPYSFPPAADELAELRDSTIYPRMDHKNVYSPYPPLLHILFWTGLKAGQIFGLQHFAGFKLIFVLVDLCLVIFLFRLLAQANIDPRWAILYAWHPLPIIEIAGSGHTDGVGALTLVFAIAFLLQRRYFLATIFLALGFLVKFITVFLLPFLFVAAWKDLSLKKAGLIVVIFVFVVAGSYAPFSAAGEKLFSGLMVYTEKWRFNDGFFSLIFSGVHPLLSDQIVTYLMIPPDWEISEVTLTTRRIDLALIISKIVVGLIFALIYIRVLLQILRPKAASAIKASWPAIVIAIFAAFFLLSPTLQPWYLLWILPLLCMTQTSRNQTGEKVSQPALPQASLPRRRPGLAGLPVNQLTGQLANRPTFCSFCKILAPERIISPLWILSATIFLSYWVLVDYIQFGVWHEPGWVKWIEFGIPLVIWLLSLGKFSIYTN